LSARQKKKLLGILIKGPLESGYATDLWTLRRIGEVIEKHFGVRYCIASVWKVMDSFRWSCQRPKTKARERNEAAIRRWKRHVWPGIKKSPKASGASGLLG
jgi:transposase